MPLSYNATGKHCGGCIINRNNVTVEHRYVILTQDEVIVLETCTVITNTPVRCIMLHGLAILLQKTLK
jgi:hypothetical protein